MIEKNLKKITKKINYLATPVYDSLPVWFFPERQLRFKAYCVGLQKTGTVTIHIMFNKYYRSCHEPENKFLIRKIVAFNSRKISESEFTKYIKQRDRRLSLEMDSSNLNYHLIDILVNEFKEAKFILTIRNCYSWLDSYLNFIMLRPRLKNTWLKTRYEMKMTRLYSKTNQPKYAKEEKILEDNGLVTLDDYLSYWAEHNNKILNIVPKDKLLVIKTQQINQNILEIETFLRIKTSTLLTNIHSNKGIKKFNLLSKINSNFLAEKINFHCGELMDKYFPEIKFPG